MKKYLAALIIISAIALLTLYATLIMPNTSKHTKLCIPKSATPSYVQKHMLKIVSHPTLMKLALKLKPIKHFFPGCYCIKPGMSDKQIINMVSSGANQCIIKFSIPPTYARKSTLIILAKKNLDIDTSSLKNLLNNNNFLKQFGFNSNDILTMFLSATYFFYWSVSAKHFLKKIYHDYSHFWNKYRLAKAKTIGLTPKQIVILASIVQAEQRQHPDEWPVIAGLYINRLKKNMPLQADPTIIYAWNNDSIHRIYNYMLKIKSPFNTYTHTGLPPAPITFTSPKAIDAVLNYKKSNYLYMVAKADLSGYHHFSSTLKEHLIYAKKYQQALNKLGIK